MDNIFITFLASFMIWVLFMGLFVLWVIDGKMKKEQVLHALFGVVVALLATMIIKELFPTPRPFEEFKLSPSTFTTPSDPSFPSSHTAVAFALGMSVFLHDKRYGVLYFWGAVLVAVGRVLANVHYPSDIVAGALIGIIIAWATSRVHLFGLLKRSN